MPEGDTVWHTAATLRQHLAGRTLTRCDIRVPRFATVDLTGQVVDEVLSRGKHLFIRVGRASIHSHLKMDGSWRVGNRPVRVDHRARIILEAGDDSRRRRRSRACWRSSTATRTATRSRIWVPTCWAPDWDPQACRREPDGTPGPPDRRGAAGPAGAGRDRQCVLQRIVFRQRAAAHRAGERDHRSASPGVSRPGHVVAQPIPLEPLHHRRHPAGPAAVGLRAGRAELPSLRHPHPATTTPASGWRTGARPASSEH